MLSVRVKSALVFVPLLLLVSWLGGLVYFIFILVMLGIGTWEYWRLLKTMGYDVSFPLMLAGVELLLILRQVNGFAGSDIALLLILGASAIISLVRYNKVEAQAVLTFGLHVSGILYLGWLGGYFLSLSALPKGNWWAMVTLALVWMADLGGYIFGAKWGKHKMSLRLSPRKTWEGYLGGVIFGVASGLILSLALRLVLPELALWEGAVMGLVLALVTPFGDLFISMLKRAAGVKDSGTLIPGHGGVLDRADTWLWAMMLGYYLVLTFA
jgi:phosphatidate cytidylyltransferase